MKKAIYKIEYYVTDKRFGWNNTKHDMVLATSEETALKKFKEKHPDIKVATVVNIFYADY